VLTSGRPKNLKLSFFALTGLFHAGFDRFQSESLNSVKTGFIASSSILYSSSTFIPHFLKYTIRFLYCSSTTFFILFATTTGTRGVAPYFLLLSHRLRFFCIVIMRIRHAVSLLPSFGSCLYLNPEQIS